MAIRITIPTMDFSGFYYPQILEQLIQYKRQNVPEHTDESQYDPFIQLLRAFALVGHLNNVLIDLVANECTLPTAKLTETVRNMLRLISYEMAPASPAQAEMLYELSKVFTTASQIIPDKAQCSNRREGANPVVYFEVDGAVSIEPTDEIGKAFTAQGATEPQTWADVTDDINNPADDFAPWAAPGVYSALYVGHQSILWDKLGFWLTSGAVNISGVWEYYDGNFAKTSPTSVATYSGGRLIVDLTSYLGATNRQGTRIRIQYNETTAFEDCISLWNGSINYLLTTGYLGQTVPSIVAEDYTVGSDWEVLEAVDGTSQLQTTGNLELTLPKSVTRNWIKGVVQTVEAYWLRFRITAVATPTSPVIQYARIDQGKQYVAAPAIQGRTITDVLGSSDGTPNQSFETSTDYYIDNSETVNVDGEAWVRVTNFLSSSSTDRHYRIQLGANDRATVVFGDGVSGRIPPIGVNNINITYRFGGDSDGNLGANTITLDKTGLSYVNKLWNPRAAYGWSAAEGADETSLEQAKIEGPASIRIGATALSPGDMERKVVDYTDENGSTPFSRAKAFEEGFGPKTIELVLVAKGGGLASNETLTALDEYLNGDPYSHPPKEKRVIANQEAVCVNYTPKVINIVATVYTRTAVESESIENQLTAVIQPETLKEDGVTYEWEFGGEVPVSRIIHEIFETSEDITRVDLTTPSSNVALQPREMPMLGTVTLTIIEE